MTHPTTVVSVPNAQPGRDREMRLGRRGLFSRAALMALAGGGAAAATSRAKASPPSVSAEVDPGSLTRKLVSRLTFGFTEGEYSVAQNLGYQGYLERQLNLTAADEDPAVTAVLNNATLFPWLNATNDALQAQFQINGGVIANDLINHTIFRSVFSRLQLFERMVEFWSDHFSMDVSVDQLQWLKMIDDRAIRANAMRSFEELVNASARSAAMLNYLDNDVSRVGAINENYARELMELHTLSVNGGYTQADVVAVARCLTGWTWWSRNPPTPADYGTFRYNSGNHDNNAKTLSPIFNRANPTQPLVIPAGGGQNDAQTVINILVAHPNTADFIATKLCQRFLGEGTPRAVIDSVKAAYLSTTPKGDVRTMLRAIFDPNVLADAGQKIKRPFHLFASAMRPLLAGPSAITAFSTLQGYYFRAGQRPFNWSPPDGYPDSNEYWTGLVLPRWNFAAGLVTSNNSTGGTTGGINGVSVNAATVDAFFPGMTTRDQILAKLNQSLFGGVWPQAERDAIRTFLPSGTLTATNKRDALGLAFSSPTFQYV